MGEALGSPPLAALLHFLHKRAERLAVHAVKYTSNKVLPICLAIVDSEISAGPVPLDGADWASGIRLGLVQLRMR